MEQQQQQQQQSSSRSLPATPPAGLKQVRRSSLKMASSCLKKYQNQQLPKSALSPFTPIKARSGNTMKMKRRSSLTNTAVVHAAHGGSRRGHSDMALGSSTASSGIAHLRRVASSKKNKLGRSISWDVRPPRVHETKKRQMASAAKQQQESSNDSMMMDDDKNESWYSKEEYSNIIKEQMSHIAIMRYLRENGTDESQLDPEQYCERGLESYQSKEKHSEIDVKRKLHRFLVIREQARQSIMGSNDPELLRLMASQQSEGSLRKAQLRAALDQHEVAKKCQQRLTEEEKLQVAMAQHQKILQVKQLQALEDIVTQQNCQNPTQQQPQPKQEQTPPLVAQDVHNPASGIMTLASLWAQDSGNTKPASTPTQSSNELNALGSDIGMLKITSPAPSPARSVDPNAFWKKTSSSTTGISVSKLPQHSMVPQDAMMFPASASTGICPNKGSYGGAPGTGQSQALQNAFCSTFVHDQQNKQHASTPSFFIRNSMHGNKNSAVASVMPTSALAAMNLQDPQQQQHQQQQQSHSSLSYASLLQQNSR